MNEIATAQEQLREIVRDLEAIRARLAGVQAGLREPEGEDAKLLDVDEMDTGEEIRAVIGCVLNDSIGPAIRDLRDAGKTGKG